MNKFNIVTNLQINYKFKTSSHFIVNLGLAITKQDKGGRKLNDPDEFAYYYNLTYDSIAHSQGNIGNINFYLDLKIKDNTIIFFYEKEKYTYKYDEIMILENGIDFYLGHLIKLTEIAHNDKIELKIEPKSITKKEEQMIINLLNKGKLSFEEIADVVEVDLEYITKLSKTL